MTFTAAVASGSEATGDLKDLLHSGFVADDFRWAEHRGQAVAWKANHPWVRSVDDGDVLLVLDGELHNLFDAELPQAALLHRRYRDTGEEFARDLLGDFVVLILDRPRKRLVVARDPLGVRPWYQATSGPRHAGATDVATLSALPWVDDSVDETMALAYLAHLPQSRGPTLHRGIVTLSPGTTWTASGGGPARLWRHHRWRIEPEPDLSWDGAVERTRDVVDEAVRSRVRAAGSATSELSGGLDSSSIVGTAVALGYDDLLTGRLVFEGWEADERRYSDSVVEHWGLKVVSTGPWLASAEELVELNRVLRRPPPDPNYLMSVTLQRALLAEGRTSGMTGIGGDDAFEAMPYRSRIISTAQQHQYRRLAAALVRDLRSPSRGWRRLVRPTIGHLLRRDRWRPPPHVSASAAAALDLAAMAGRTAMSLTGVQAIDDRAEGLTSGYLAFTLEDGAVVDDLVGWRSTHPFLDPRVITATYGLDPWFPVRLGRDRSLERAAFGERLPAAVRDRRDKVHFSEVVRAYVSTQSHEVERIATGPLVERGWLDPVGWSPLARNAQQGRAEAALPCSRVVFLDRWLRASGA